MARARTAAAVHSLHSGLLEFYRSDDGQRLLLRHALCLAGCAFALWAIFSDGRIDTAIAHWFFDDAQQVFPLREQWLLKTVLHDAVRTASAVAALTLLGLTLTSWTAKRPALLHAHRRQLLFAAIACVAAAATAGALKHFSAHVCPWDLPMFGGAPDVVRGCLPAAHPLSGYAWLGVGFAIYPAARHAARRVFIVAVVLGTLFGVVQMLRGAHFLSHVLWSAWIVWAVNVALLAICQLRSVRHDVRLTHANEPSAS